MKWKVTYYDIQEQRNQTEVVEGDKILFNETAKTVRVMTKDDLGKYSSLKHVFTEVVRVDLV